jgi:chaperone modulatory protein CbpM
MIISKHAFLTSSRIEVQMLEFWIEQHWLIPAQTDAGLSFSATDVARAHLIRDLKGDFGVNDEGVDVILHLVDQLHGLRRALGQLHQDFRAPSPASTLLKP